MKFGKLIKIITRPFILCWQNKPRTILWFIYILLGGLLGVGINLINRCIFGGFSFQEAIYLESINGTFYTYAIVLVSTTIGPLFFNISESKILHYPDIKSFTITFSIFVLIFCAIFYSNSEKEIIGQYTTDTETSFVIDGWQLLFFVVSILIALYSLGLEYLEKDHEHNKDIDANADYKTKEDKDVKGLTESNPTTAGNGVEV